MIIIAYFFDRELYKAYSKAKDILLRKIKNNNNKNKIFYLKNKNTKPGRKFEKKSRGLN